MLSCLVTELHNKIRPLMKVETLPVLECYLRRPVNSCESNIAIFDAVLIPIIHDQGKT